jgi:hypothetical protein
MHEHGMKLVAPTHEIYHFNNSIDAVKRNKVIHLYL